jgi:hypothetical protein
MGTILAASADGLWGYSPTGKLRFHLFAGRAVCVYPVWFRRVGVSVGRRHVTIELPSGRVVRSK